MIIALFIFILVGLIISLAAIGFFYLRKNQYLVGLFSFCFFVFAFSLIFWPNIKALFPYSYAELGGDGLQKQAYEAINQVRTITNRRWQIRSGYRSIQKNKTVGGALNSQHVKGVAFDVKVPMSRRSQFYNAAKKAGFTAYGWGNNTVHIDMGPKRWWTYDSNGKAVSGGSKAEYLHKAPNNFKKDFELE